MNREELDSYSWTDIDRYLDQMSLLATEELHMESSY